MYKLEKTNDKIYILKMKKFFPSNFLFHGTMVAQPSVLVSFFVRKWLEGKMAF